MRTLRDAIFHKHTILILIFFHFIFYDTVPLVQGFSLAFIYIFKKPQLEADLDRVMKTRLRMLHL